MVCLAPINPTPMIIQRRIPYCQTYVEFALMSFLIFSLSAMSLIMALLFVFASILYVFLKPSLKCSARRRSKFRPPISGSQAVASIFNLPWEEEEEEEGGKGRREMGEMRGTSIIRENSNDYTRNRLQ